MRWRSRTGRMTCLRESLLTPNGMYACVHLSPRFPVSQTTKPKSHECKHRHVHVFKDRGEHTYMHTQMRAYTHANAFTHTNTHTHAHTYTRAHTHTPSNQVSMEKELELPAAPPNLLSPTSGQRPWRGTRHSE